ncbi:HET-domain-containing protein [Thozetella sp. PMI_491]|nr:HET-domain-containing protein [Thozetella sp. PMI_491]
MESFDSFQYKALPSSNHFRLLQISTGRPEHPTVAQDEIVSPDTHPSYAALSYVWGSDEKPYVLQLLEEGANAPKRLSITASLYKALSSIRSFPGAQPTPRVWADAVCINQDDQEEKAHQVRRMAQLYGEAEQVIAYLCDNLMEFGGAHSDASELAVEHDGKLLPPEDDPGWASLRTIITSKWPTRAWVLQEAILAKRLVLMAGMYEFDSSSYFMVAFAIGMRKLPAIVDSYLQIDGDSQSGTHKAIMDLSMLKNYVRGGVRASADGTIHPVAAFAGGVTLGHALIQTRQTTCKDPRDKIYALMGVAIDGTQLGIAVDYTQPVADLYREVAYRILGTRNGYDILCHAHGAKNHDLPSWVPDWSINRNLYPDETKQFNAGDRIASVRALPTTREIQKLDMDVVGPWVATLASLDSHPMTRARYPNDVIEAVSRALISGKLGDECRDGWALFVNVCVGYRNFQNQHRAGGEEKSDDELLALAVHELGANHIPRFMDFWRYLQRSATLVFSDCFFVASQGWVGNAGLFARQDDTIVIPYGSNVPFIIRPAPDGEGWKLAGPCYVEGLMRGEAFDGEVPNDGSEGAYIVLS